MSGSDVASGVAEEARATEQRNGGESGATECWGQWAAPGPTNRPRSDRALRPPGVDGAEQGTAGVMGVRPQSGGLRSDTRSGANGTDYRRNRESRGDRAPQGLRRSSRELAVSRPPLA